MISPNLSNLIIKYIIMIFYVSFMLMVNYPFVSCTLSQVTLKIYIFVGFFIASAQYRKQVI